MKLLILILAILPCISYARKCCLPEKHQFVMLNEMRIKDYPHRIYSRVMLAGDHEKHMQAIHIDSAYGRHAVFVNISNGDVHGYDKESEFCCRGNMAEMLDEMKDSMCINETSIMKSPMSLKLAGGESAKFISGHKGKARYDAVVAKSCAPVFTRVEFMGTETLSIYGNFTLEPEDDNVKLPKKCRGSSVPECPKSMKEREIHLPYGPSMQL